MAILEVNKTWVIPAAGSSVAGLTLSPLKMDVAPLYTALYLESSTLASTQSFALQTAISSGGPWVTEGSTSCSATNNSTTCDVLRLTGPYVFARPKLLNASTGVYTFRLVAVG